MSTIFERIEYLNKKAFESLKYPYKQSELIDNVNKQIKTYEKIDIFEYSDIFGLISEYVFNIIVDKILKEKELSIDLGIFVYFYWCDTEDSQNNVFETRLQDDGTIKDYIELVKILTKTVEYFIEKTSDNEFIKKILKK